MVGQSILPVMIERTFKFGSTTTVIRDHSVNDLVRDMRDLRGLVVCDENTAEYLSESGLPTLILPAGESHKNWDSVNRILSRAVELELGRDATFVGFGGGVVCDMTGFAASVYLRGCNLILVPTTLLSMVDASIGGKTGIDYAGYKNLVGSFYPAEQVDICIDVLETLPEREYRSGLAEVIKHGFLGAEDVLVFFESSMDAVESRRRSAVELCISRSLDVKGAIVAEDLRESGVRAHLNLGHTFAHALEAAAGFGAWSHGEAVAWGIDRAMLAGVRAGVTDPTYAKRVNTLLGMYGYRLGPVPDGIDEHAVVASMKQDKKKKDGTLRFVLQRSLGDTIVLPLDEEIVLGALTSDHTS
jgi:3-dehydroquinate synthase